MHHLKFTCWSLALYLLALTLIHDDDHQVHGADYLILQNDHQEATNQIHIHTHSSSHHMDQSTLVFFTLDDLKLGKSLPIYFRATNPSNPPKFLPSDEAELIPFKHSKLTYLLHYFGFTQGSSQAKAMENTLRECEVEGIKGETKFCATSLESMLIFVHEMLGATPKALNTQQSAKFANVLQNYTIVDEPREIPSPKMVACHTMSYPYVIYYCHYQKSPSKVFQVSLRAQNNGGDDIHDDDGIEAVAVCHMDTSQWSPNHVSFKLLGVKPGTCPICHFFPADNLVWVPLSVTHDESFENKAYM